MRRHLRRAGTLLGAVLLLLVLSPTAAFACGVTYQSGGGQDPLCGGQAPLTAAVAVAGAAAVTLAVLSVLSYLRGRLPAKDLSRILSTLGHPALATSTRWSGARHVSASSVDAEDAYSAIRAKAVDVAKIAEATGIHGAIIGRVKAHLFLTEHDVPIGPNQMAHGYFTADEDIAALWNRAEQGALSPSDHHRFRSLIAHEYVESQLMQAGMPYRSANPAAWEEGTLMFNSSHFGAHEVAPLSADGSLRVWPRLGLTPPDTPIASDLSNIDLVVDAARRGLNL